MSVYRIGQRVTATTASGAELEKIVYAVNPYGPLICSPVEYALARAEDREPRGTGWPAEAIHPRD